MLAPDHTILEELIKDYDFEGFQAMHKLTIELLKLNVYGTNLHFCFMFAPSSINCSCPGKGSFSDPHIYPPHRVGQRVGSLIIIFPTPHEGGTLVLTHENNEWSFDYGAGLVPASEPSIGYVVFFGDVPHGVTPVKSGHCVTLTYELYLGDVEPVSGNGPASGDLIPCAGERAFRENFEALLENPEFLPDGGTLGFGMKHVYPIKDKDDVKHVYDLLKGSDAVVYRGARALGFEPLLYLLYEWTPPDMVFEKEGGLIERPIDFTEYAPMGEHLDLIKIIRRKGGIVTCQDLNVSLEEEGAYGRPENIEWVTPKTVFNGQESSYITLWGLEPVLKWVYGDLCLVVRVGKAGERLAYPTSAELEEVFGKEGDVRPSAFWNRME